MPYDLTYDPIVGTGLPAEPGTQVLGAAIESRWVTAATSDYDGRTFEVGFVGGPGPRHRQEAIRWLVDMAEMTGMQLLEAGGRTWKWRTGWRPSNDVHSGLYIEQTSQAAATLSAVLEPSGDPVAYVVDDRARPVNSATSRVPHWRVYADGLVLPVNGAAAPRVFPTVAVSNPVVAAWAQPGGLRLITQNGDTPFVPCAGRFAAPQPPVVVNTGQGPPSHSVPAPAQTR